MKRDICFGEFRGAYWRDPRDLERYFLDPTGDAWPRQGGNDSWGLNANGLYATDKLPNEINRVNVYLILTGFTGPRRRYFVREMGRTIERESRL